MSSALSTESGLASVQRSRHHCLVLLHAEGAHLEQIHAGLAMLQRAGAIRLSYRLTPTPSWPADPPMLSRHRSHLRVVLDGVFTIHYDLDDSEAMPREAVSAADAYFKRSLPIDCTHSSHVFPLGLHMPVRCRPSGLALFAQSRVRFRLHVRRPARVGRPLSRRVDWQYLPTVAELEQTPEAAGQKVIFLSRAWDPRDGKNSEQAQQRNEANEMRAGIVRLLRAELGRDFTGGIEPDAYGQAAYPDCLAPARTFDDKRRYLVSLATSTIGVASEGLHGSIGWKMAEYVAASRAIVTERLDTVLPGDFGEPSNYLSFATAEECLRAACRLRSDLGLQTQMMTANRDYWLEYLRPDVLVARSLITALELAGREPSDRLMSVLPESTTGLRA